jgi:acylphosphatase
MSDAKDERVRAKAATIHAVVDRVEDGGVAVLLVGDDEKTKIDLPASLLPEGVNDGDHLKITITPDHESRAAAAERVKKLQEQLAEAGGAQEQKDFKL